LLKTHCSFRADATTEDDQLPIVPLRAGLVGLAAAPQSAPGAGARASLQHHCDILKPAQAGPMASGNQRAAAGGVGGVGIGASPPMGRPALHMQRTSVQQQMSSTTLQQQHHRVSNSAPPPNGGIAAAVAAGALFASNAAANNSNSVGKARQSITLPSLSPAVASLNTVNASAASGMGLGGLGALERGRSGRASMYAVHVRGPGACFHGVTVGM
jgi:hypothetical protein